MLLLLHTQLIVYALAYFDPILEAKIDSFLIFTLHIYHVEKLKFLIYFFHENMEKPPSKVGYFYSTWYM